MVKRAGRIEPECPTALGPRSTDSRSGPAQQRPTPVRRVRSNQLHVWLDQHEADLLARLASHYRESESVLVRRLIRLAATRVVATSAT